MKMWKKTSLIASFLMALLFTVISVDNADAHCPWNDPLHCASHLDPTRYIPGSARAVEEIWGETGRGLYSTAAEFMTRDNVNIPRQQLDSRQKELLRPEFGSLVDRVTVQYGADMMDRWGAGNFQISAGSAGQTFCNKIYIQDSYRRDSENQLFLLAHELQHSRQCENFDGMSNFGYRYFKEFKKADQNYENNALEVEAREVADRVFQQLARIDITQIQNVHNQIIGGDGGPQYVDAAKSILRREGASIQDVRNFLVDQFSEGPIQRIHDDVIGGDGGPLYVDAAKSILRREGASRQDVRNFLVDQFSEGPIQRIHDDVIGGDGGPQYVDAAKGILRGEGASRQDVRNFLVDQFSERPIQRIHDEVLGGDGGPLYVEAAKSILREDGASLQDVRDFLITNFSR